MYIGDEGSTKEEGRKTKIVAKLARAASCVRYAGERAKVAQPCATERKCCSASMKEGEERHTWLNIVDRN